MTNRVETAILSVSLFMEPLLEKYITATVVLLLSFAFGPDDHHELSDTFDIVRLGVRLTM